jgi:predicted transcriptional regulator
MKKDKYHVKIQPEFLFDEYKVFESSYTPWVYLYLKLKNNYFLYNAPQKMYGVDVLGIAVCLSTTQSTVYNALKELESTGLLETNKRKYRIFDESVYKKQFQKIDVDAEKKYPKFLQVYNNDFDELLMDIKKQVLPLGTNKRLIVKGLELYYYLIAGNRHCLLTKKPLVESILTQTSLEKLLGREHRVIKYLLSVLEDTGWVLLKQGKIYTLKKGLYDPKDYTFAETAADTKPAVSKAETVTVNPAETNDVPKSFIGYAKSRDGQSISVIYYSKKLKSITLSGWCKGDGVPMTSEEFEMNNDLLQSGKNSKYYDPQNYWLYKPAA